MELHEDDLPVGRLLSRREMLALLGGAGAALVAGTGFTRLNQVFAQTPTPTPSSTPEMPTCIVKPALTEGPYFVEEVLNRSDIRIDPTDDSLKEGVMLTLQFNVTQVSANACTPLPDAQVDIWHCDAAGVYSGVTDPGFDTSGQIWLRGYQITDEDGIARFITIYPGWYPGRTVHIHFKIRVMDEAQTAYDFTSQLFFEEATSDLIYALPPYNRRGERNTYNEEDGIFRVSEGLLTLDVVEDEEEAGAYVAVFNIGLDLSELPAQSGGRPGGRPTRPTPTPAGDSN